jgi:hypothetical protein
MSENEDYFGQPMSEYGPNKLPPYYVMWKPHQPNPGKGGGVSSEWGYDDTGGTVGRVDSRPGERGCDGCCG